MRRSAYVLAVVGESPAVLSELLWWLCTKEQRSIAGIEVWATGRGADRLAELVASPAWGALEQQTGPLPALEPPETPPANHHGFRIHTFTVGQRVLDDVRTQPESEAVSGCLHDRVRSLRQGLADSIDIVGSLAGGRKTVSAALQTAFCLQAGPTDRLVHVLLDPTFEHRLRASGGLADFCAPDENLAWDHGVPMADQIIVYDVPFPRIRHLVRRRLSQALDDLPWKEVWPVLEESMSRSPEARLVRLARESWRFEIVDSRDESEIWAVELQGRLGAMMAAMASVDEDAKAADVADWIDANDVGWELPGADHDDATTRAGTIRTVASVLRDEFKTLPIGLEDLAPPARGYAAPRVRVFLDLD